MNDLGAAGSSKRIALMRLDIDDFRGEIGGEGPAYDCDHRERQNQGRLDFFSRIRIAEAAGNEDHVCLSQRCPGKTQRERLK